MAVEAALRRRDLNLRVRERLELVEAAALGHDLPAIARSSGRSGATGRRGTSGYGRVSRPHPYHGGTPPRLVNNPG